MDPNKDMEEYKKEWTDKVIKDSENLFNVAEKVLETKPNIKVVIIKRLPRHDPLHQDPLHIKQSLSEYANSFYNQLWFKKGGPKNIHVVNFDGIESSGYLKDIIYAKSSAPNYDGIHLRGRAAMRHFTYRAIEAIKPVFGSRRNLPSDHVNCPQAQYQRNHQSKSSHG